jgi:hypothetical protein
MSSETGTGCVEEFIGAAGAKWDCEDEGSPALGGAAWGIGAAGFPTGAVVASSAPARIDGAAKAWALASAHATASTAHNFASAGLALAALADLSEPQWRAGRGALSAPRPIGVEGLASTERQGFLTGVFIAFSFHGF